MFKCTTGEIRICDEYIFVGIVVLENLFCTFLNEILFFEDLVLSLYESERTTSKVRY